jgi:hypothetical protein
MGFSPSRVDSYLPCSLIATLAATPDRSSPSRACSIHEAERLEGGCLLYRLRREPRSPSWRLQGQLLHGKSVAHPGKGAVPLG